MTSSGIEEAPLVTAPAAPPDVAATADETLFEAPSVLRILWADPQHMAEHLADWSHARFGPRAGPAVERLRSGKDVPRQELERLVVERQTRVSMTVGAFIGGPFVVLIPFAFCAALLAQAQMVFELAAVAGRDPTDQERASELLVLLGAYPTTDAAAEALAALPRDTKSAGKKLPAGTRIDMVKRMMYLLEVLGPSDQKRSTFRDTIGWIGVGVLVLAGLVLPLVWVPYMAYSSRRYALKMGTRARRFYATEGASAVVMDADAAPVEKIQVGGALAFARMTILIVFPVLVALVGLLTGFSFAGGKWLSAIVLLLVLSALATLGWIGFRWWRYRRASR
jgi:hypothetical protein